MRSKQQSTESVGAVMVVGGGITGITSALDLAEAGYKVYLVEKGSVIGGTVSYLEEQFPTNNCQMCSLSTKQHSVCRKRLPLWTEDTGKHENIDVFTDAEVVSVTGEPGNFQVKIKQTDVEQELNLGAIILTPGASLFNPRQLERYGFGVSPNVVTSLEFEQALAPTDTTDGRRTVRSYDGKEPQKIAWIQCVGSRDAKESRGYCSSICCMTAIKEALMAQKYSVKPLEITIFNMDIRTYAKECERYYQQATKQPGIKFERSNIYKLEEADDGSHDLIIRYAKLDGTIVVERFDMVVLSIGFSTDENTIKLAGTMGIELNEYGFCLTNELEPSITSRTGIFAGGVFCGPKDIADSIIDASAAAARASMLLTDVRGSLVQTKIYPVERDISREKTKIGVFICNGGGVNIGDVVNTAALADFAQGMKNVAYVEQFAHACAQDSLLKIKQAIVNEKLNRVVVASCTPRLQEQVFRNILKEAAINPYLYEHVNIREQVSWVHRQYPERATEKAKDLLKMAISKVGLMRPIKATTVNILPRVLVVGGGIAGLVSALALSKQGYQVVLVEKTEQLGGYARNIKYTLEGNNPIKLINDLTKEVTADSNIEVILNTEIENVAGYVGNYRTILKHQAGDTTEVQHGAVIIASGAKPVQPEQYLYGENAAVVTQNELEDQLVSQSLANIKNVVMIQCVDSREADRLYCSRICCSQAIKNALKIKELNPKTNVFVLFRDMRTYGLKEKYYTEARQKGVIFIRFSLADKPVVNANGNEITVAVKDHILGETMTINTNLVVLSSGIEASQDNQQLSRLFKVPLDDDKFFAEKNIKFRPMDSEAEGIYICGLASGPKTLAETITQAYAVAMRAVTFLCKGKTESLATTAMVDEEVCNGCGLCVDNCSYGARTLDSYRKIAKVDALTCRGCGTCVAVCPSGASQQRGYEQDQILAMIDAIL
jgi:heterodisulfide reductase subunit A-like polyferredoxin